MSSVPNFTGAEQWAVETTLKEHWPHRHIELQLADIEIRIYPQDRELTVCPALYRVASSTSHVIIKVADRTCRSQSDYCGFQQYRTGKIDYDDITDVACITLQVHADREARDREESTRSVHRIPKHS